MDKNADNTPKFEENTRVKVAGQGGVVERVLEDGRILVRFDTGQREPIEPDKIKA